MTETMAPEISEPSEEPGPREERDSTEQRLKYLAKANHIARTRCRGLVVSLRDARDGDSSVRSHAAKLESDLSQCHGELGKVSGELESARSGREQAERSFADQRAEVERLQWELGELSSVRDDLAVQQSAGESQRQELESQLAERENRLGELSGELESARIEREQAEQSRSEQVVQIDRLQAELSTLEAARQTWGSEQTLAEQHLREIESVLSGRENRLGELTGELDSAREQIVQLEHEANGRMAEYQLLQDERRNLLDAIEKLELAQSTGEQQQRALQQVLGDRDDRIEQLLGGLESSESEREQTQQAVAEQNAVQEQLQAELATLKVARDQLVADRSASQQRLQEMENDLSGHDRRLEQVRCELTAAHKEIGQTAGQTALLQEARDRVDELEKSLRQNESEVGALAGARGKWQEDKQCLSEQIDQYQQQCEQLEIELESTRDRLVESDCRHDQLQRRYEEVAHELEESSRSEANLATQARDDGLVALRDDKAQETSAMASSAGEQPSGQPVSFIDQYQHLLEEDDFLEPDCGTGGNEMASPPSSASTLTGSMGSGTNHGEEDSDAALEVYMSNMLQRVCGDSAAGQKGLLRERAPVAAAQQQGEMKEAVATETVRSIERESVSPSSKNPDPDVDITAMRELANHSADQALATHWQRHQTHEILSKLVYGGIAMVVALLLILRSDHYGSPAFLGGCLAAMAGFYWAIQLSISLPRMIRTGDEVETRVESRES